MALISCDGVLTRPSKSSTISVLPDCRKHSLEKEFRSLQSCIVFNPNFSTIKHYTPTKNSYGGILESPCWSVYRAIDFLPAQFLRNCCASSMKFDWRLCCRKEMRIVFTEFLLSYAPSFKILVRSVSQPPPICIH